MFKLKWKDAALPGIGGALAVMVILLVGDVSSLTLLMAPFGATCVLAFALPDSPLAGPRSIIGGHLLSTFVGLLIWHMVGSHAWSLAAAVGIAIFAMKVTKTLHPPAGADPLVVMLSGSSWSFLITPVLLGTLLIVGSAWLFRTLTAPKERTNAAA